MSLENKVWGRSKSWVFTWEIKSQDAENIKGREQGGREQGKVTHNFSGHCLTGSLEKISKAASEAVRGPDRGEKVEEIL